MAQFLRFHDVQRRNVQVPHVSDHLALAPNLDAAHVDPSLLTIHKLSDLRTRRELCIGKHASIIQGPYKGYECRIIQSSKDAHLEVEIFPLGGRKAIMAATELALIRYVW